MPGPPSRRTRRRSPSRAMPSARARSCIAAAPARSPPSPGSTRATRPDPLADAAAGIIEHMNGDHADALVTFARVLAGADADEAAMVGVDRLGFKLRITHEGRVHSARIPFPREVLTTAECRQV